MKIIDPTDERTPIRRSLARRPEAIHGTVALLDINKPRGDVLMDQVAVRLAERYPGVAVKRYKKPTFTRPAPDDLLRLLASEADFVIEALAD